jgi:hypothetical protein
MTLARPFIVHVHAASLLAGRALIPHADVRPLDHSHERRAPLIEFGVGSGGRGLAQKIANSNLRLHRALTLGH